MYGARVINCATTGWVPGTDGAGMGLGGGGMGGLSDWKQWPWGRWMHFLLQDLQAVAFNANQTQNLLFRWRERMNLPKAC